MHGCMGRQRNSQMKERAILLLGWRCLAQNNNNADGAVVVVLRTNFIRQHNIT
jgi:hypothetical protein